jgi:glycosyltransferase involved in cell wall biosynthesis
VRILIVTHALLTNEFGASQIAINLGEELRAKGHDVTLWSPQPLPLDTHWWRTLPAMRSRLDEFLKTQEPFDVIDCPAPLVTRYVSRATSVVVRSIQPDLLYLRSSLGFSRGRGLRGVARLPFEYAHAIYLAALVLRGWARARRIICLGSLELRWMRRWFPWWRGKLTSYFCALSETDQSALAEVRRKRASHASDCFRFLWIGRWAAHKGTAKLLDFIKQWTVQRPQDTFTIAGCGADAERNFPPELLNSGVVKIIPTFGRGELYTLLAEHDIGLFTSKVEGWGLSLNEMLESGMPVYATPVGGTIDLQPYFSTLRTFPPFLDSKLKEGCGDPLDDYLERFNWARIAESYALSVTRHTGASGGSAESELALESER